MRSVVEILPVEGRSRSQARRPRRIALSQSIRPPRELPPPRRKRYATWRVRHYRLDRLDTYGRDILGGVPMSQKLGVLALLEAKPGKGDDLGKFLEGGRDIARTGTRRPRWGGAG